MHDKNSDSSLALWRQKQTKKLKLDTWIWLKGKTHPGEQCQRKAVAKSRNISSCSAVLSHSCPTLCNPMDCSLPGSSNCGDSTGKKTGVGCHPSSRGSSQLRDRTQVWSLHCRQNLYHLSHPGKQCQSKGVVNSRNTSSCKKTEIT